MSKFGYMVILGVIGLVVLVSFCAIRTNDPVEDQSVVDEIVDD